MAKKHNIKTRARKEPKEFEEEVLQIDRVTRVVKGGRRLRFRATVIVGNKKGKVNIGIGKSSEVATAIQKGIAKAKKNMIEVPMVNDTIPHDIKIKYKSCEILMMPASKGTGIVAGGSMRKILNICGVKNVLGKTFRSNNRIINAQTTIKALKLLKPISMHPNKEVFEITKKSNKPEEQKEDIVDKKTENKKKKPTNNKTVKNKKTQNKSDK